MSLLTVVFLTLIQFIIISWRRCDLWINTSCRQCSTSHASAVFPISGCRHTVSAVVGGHTWCTEKRRVRCPEVSGVESEWMEFQRRSASNTRLVYSVTPTGHMGAPRQNVMYYRVFKSGLNMKIDHVSMHSSQPNQLLRGPCPYLVPCNVPYTA